MFILSHPRKNEPRNPLSASRKHKFACSRSRTSRFARAQTLWTKGSNTLCQPASVYPFAIFWWLPKGVLTCKTFASANPKISHFGLRRNREFYSPAERGRRASASTKLLVATASKRGSLASRHAALQRDRREAAYTLFMLCPIFCHHARQVKFPIRFLIYWSVIGRGGRSKFAEQIYAERSEERPMSSRHLLFGTAQFFPIQG